MTTSAPEPISRTAVATIPRPLLRMRWASLTYLHWEVDPAHVAALLPAGLAPDTLDGRAYVGLVPFRMAGISLGRLPLPAGTFPETNVRTYVLGPDGGRGVYFHSLDITRLAPTAVARVGYQLPYAWSRMAIGHRGDRVAYRAERRWPAPAGATSHVVVRVGTRLRPAEITPLDDFLAARWSLYTATPGGGLLRARVDHAEWPMRSAELLHLDDHLVAAAGYVPDGPPVHVRYGGDVDVRVGPPRRVR